jgi:hypothetical protein
MKIIFLKREKNVYMYIVTCLEPGRELEQVFSEEGCQAVTKVGSENKAIVRAAKNQAICINNSG